MENDDPSAAKSYPVAAAKLSKTPSWIMLGFLLGAAFVASLKSLHKEPAVAPPAVGAAEPAPVPPPREPPQLTTIEAVFAAEEQYAVWSDDVTEVALWNSRDNAFSDFYEVRRIGGARYFRTIPTLTRRVIQHGKPRPASPLQFTETEEQYREWQEHGRTERVPLLDLRPAQRVSPSGPERAAVAPVPVVAPPELAPLAPLFDRKPPEKK
jgi:hypothetical protein